MMTKPAAAQRDQQLKQLSDEELLLRYCQRKEPEVFDALVHRYEREMYNYLLRYTRNAQMAEEAFQLTFFKVHDKCDRFAAGRRFRPWLYSIATHQAVDTLRAEGRHRALSLDEQHGAAEAEPSALMDLLEAETPSPLSQVEAEEWRQWTRRAVDELPEHLRVVILLLYFQGLRYREVAEALGIPVGTVKSRSHKALIKLNQAWKHEHPRAGNPKSESEPKSPSDENP